MRSMLFAGAAIALTAAAFAQPARAGVEQTYEGYPMQVAAAPTVADVGTERMYEPGRVAAFSTSRVAALDVASERIATFNGQPASDTTSVFAAR